MQHKEKVDLLGRICIAFYELKVNSKVRIPHMVGTAHYSVSYKVLTIKLIGQGILWGIGVAYDLDYTKGSNTEIMVTLLFLQAAS